jgi:hypothetical protein
MTATRGADGCDAAAIGGSSVCATVVVGPDGVTPADGDHAARLAASISWLRSLVDVHATRSSKPCRAAAMRARTGARSGSS